MKYLFKNIIFLIIGFLGHQTCLAQQQGHQISTITFDGLVKNDLDYLQNFVTSRPNEFLDINQLNEDLQQLIRRTGIANAVAQIDTISSTQVDITIQISEQRTLLPRLGIGGIKGNLWWQVGLEEHNLGGKEKTLIGTYLQNDKQPNFQVFFQNARIQGGVWGFSIDVNRQSSIEPLYFPESAVDYKYSNIGVGVAVMRHFGFNRRLTIGSNLFREDYNKNNPEDIGVSEGPDELTENKLLFKAEYSVNRLKYNYFYRQGFQWTLLGQSVNTIDTDSRFIALSYEGVHFWRVKKRGNVAMRIRLALATNRESPFAPFVLDSKVNLRGVGNRVDRGTGQLVLNLEYRHTLFDNNKFAGQVVGFADLGTWRNPGGELKELFDSDQFREFIGIGVRFINKKVFQSTLRLDYGVDVANTAQRGFVFGVGQYF